MITPHDIRRRLRAIMIMHVVAVAAAIICLSLIQYAPLPTFVKVISTVLSAVIALGSTLFACLSLPSEGAELARALDAQRQYEQNS